MQALHMTINKKKTNATMKQNKKAEGSDCGIWGEEVCNHLGIMPTTFFYPAFRSFRCTI